MHINAKHLKEAAALLEKEHSIILGFTLPGELYSLTFDYNDKDKKSVKDLMFCFVDCLNQVCEGEK